MERILVGIDASSESRAAAMFAANLAGATGARLILASVSTITDPFASPELQARFRVFEEEQRLELSRLLTGLAAELRRPGMEIDTIVEAGAPASTLADLATRMDADLVVVGHRGRGAMKRLLLGSVADKLAQICTRPVTIVR